MSTDPCNVIDAERPQCFCGKVATALYTREDTTVASTSNMSPFSSRPRTEFEFSSPHAMDLEERARATAVNNYDHNSNNNNNNNIVHINDDDNNKKNHYNHEHDVSTSSYISGRSERAMNSRVRTPASKSDPPVIKTNFVYECHYTTPQRGLSLPQVCDKCEEELSRPNERELESGFEVYKRLKGHERENRERDRERVNFWALPITSASLSSSRPYTNGTPLIARQEHSGSHHGDSWTSPIFGSPTSHRQKLLPSFLTLPSLPSGYKLPGPRKRSVCGFHMHAFEWHVMQDSTDDERVAIARSAKCTAFNASVTRWLECQLNDLDLQPFNDVKCFCGDPMIIRLRKSELGHQIYELACVHRCPITLRPPGTWEHLSYEFLIGGGCSRVILLRNACYPPRSTPIHRTIDHGFYQQRQKEVAEALSFLSRKKDSILKKNPHPLALKFASYLLKNDGDTPPRRVEFKRPVEEIIPVKQHQHHHRKDDSTIPPWYNREISLGFLNEEGPYVPGWSEEFGGHLAKFGGKKMTRTMTAFLRAEAIEDATEFAAKVCQEEEEELQAMEKEAKQLEQTLEDLGVEQRKLAQEAKTMENNEKELSRISQFAQLLWRYIQYKSVGSATNKGQRRHDDLQVLATALERNGHHIRDLVLLCDIHNDLDEDEDEDTDDESDNEKDSIGGVMDRFSLTLESPNITNLTRLHVTLVPYRRLRHYYHCDVVPATATNTTTATTSSFAQQLIYRNKDTLRTLFLSFEFEPAEEPSPDQRRIWRRLGEGRGLDKQHIFRLPLFNFATSGGTLVHLQSLSLEKCSISNKSFLRILEGCPVLWELSLRSVQFHDKIEEKTGEEEDNEGEKEESKEKDHLDKKIEIEPIMDDLDELEALIAERNQQGHPEQEMANSSTYLSSTTKSSSSSTGSAASALSPSPAPAKVPEPPSYQHPNLQYFRMCGLLYPTVISHLPNLRTLELYRFDRPADPLDLSQFCHSIRWFCPRLESIWAFGFECSMIPHILQNTQRLICYRGGNDLETVLMLLDRHATTLEEANLSDYTERTFLPLKFLESCPRLKSFRSGHSSTTIAEVLESISTSPSSSSEGTRSNDGTIPSWGGWACKNQLQELRLSIYGLAAIEVDMIMTALNAQRTTETSFRVRNAVAEALMSESAIANAAAAVDVVDADMGCSQKLPHEILAGFLATLPRLEKVNLGTGWYRIKRDKDGRIAAVLVSCVPTLSLALVGNSWKFGTYPATGLTDITFGFNMAKAEHKVGYYYAQQFKFVNVKSVGYTGIQPRPNRKDGSSIVHAAFSSFQAGATSTHPNCHSGADGGPGVSCAVDVVGDYKDDYFITVENIGGTTWRGTMVNAATDASAVVGEWTLPAGAGNIRNGQVGFVEYYIWNRPGSHPCSGLPLTEAFFYHPTSTTPGASGGLITSMYDYGSCKGQVDYKPMKHDNGYSVQVGFKQP
ncbi:hypothetical protein BG004_002652 [Podila humilis]|nr:hypothetical protein BG004_002652 [Podila humilis]